MKKSAFLMLLLFMAGFSHAQTVMDSIDRELKSATGENRLRLLLRAGKVSQTKQPAKTLSYTRQAVGLATERGDQKSLGEAFLLLSDGYLSASLYDSAQFAAKSALNIFQGLKQPEGILRALNQSGLVYLNLGKTAEAEQILLETISACEREISKHPQENALKEITIDIFKNLMMTYIRQGNPALAKEKLLAFSKTRSGDNLFTEMVLEGNLSTVYQMEGRYDSALIHANKALALSRKLQDPVNESKILIDIGSIYYAAGKFSEALENYRKAVEMAMVTNEQSKLAILYNNIGSVYFKLAFYEEANRYFLKSAAIKEELKDSAGLAAAFNNVALIYKDWGNMKMARHYFGKAITLNLQRKNNKSLGINYTGMGDLFLQAGNADSALAYYTKSVDLKTQSGNKSGLVISLHGLGNVYNQLLGNDEKAMEYYRQALDLAEGIGADYEVASLNLSMGEVLMKQNNLAAAEEMLKKALSYAREENTLDLIRNSARLLTELNIRSCNKKAAADYFLLYQTAGDSLFNQRKARAVMEMQTKYETEKKEQENLVLTDRSITQKKQMWFLSAVIAALVLFGAGIYYLYMQKNQAYKKIVQKNLEILSTEKKLDRISVACRENIPVHPFIESDDSSNSLLIRLNKLIEEEKPFLSTGVTLDDLCRSLNTNRTYLSRLINEQYGHNFNEFINELRIKEATRMLADHKFDHISIEGVGNMAGFTTKVTFHSNFKRQVGITPSYFRNTVSRHFSEQSVS